MEGGSSGCSSPSRLNGDVAFGVFDGRAEPARGDPPQEGNEHRGGLSDGLRERIAPGLALLLDEPSFRHQPPQVVLRGLNRLEPEVFLYLAHRGREALQEALANELVDEIPGFPRRRLW